MTSTARADQRIYRLSVALIAITALLLVAVLTACQLATSHPATPGPAGVATTDGHCFRGADGWWCDGQRFTGTAVR